MKTKLVTNLDSLMVFTGPKANINAKALEDRKYDIFSDEYIGTLKLNKDYDSVFSNTQSEVFVETAPKYKSIKDVTQIAYAYIANRSTTKPTRYTEMSVDGYGDISFLYDYDNGLNRKIDKAKAIPVNDLMLYFASMNNSMFNKQKYYSKHKEIESLSNSGVKYFWRPAGSYFNIYDEATYTDVKHENGNDFLTYSLLTKNIQEMAWDEAEGKYVPQYEEQTVTNEDGTTTTTKVPKMRDKQFLEYEQSFSEIFASKLEDCVERFKSKHEEDKICYYLYDLNSSIETIANTYTFGQTKINANLNFDGEFNNWFDNKISFNVSSLETTEVAKITPASKYWFGLASKGENGEDIRLMEDILAENEASLVVPEQKDYSGLSILSPYKIKKLDFSGIASSLSGTLDLACEYNKKVSSKDYIKTNWIKEKGSLLEELIIGKEGIECPIENIVGLENFPGLKKVVLTGCNNLANDPDLNSMSSLEEFYLKSSNMSVFNPKAGSSIKVAQLPDCLESILLNSITFGELDYKPNATLATLELNNTQGIDTLAFVSKWVKALKEANLLDTGLVNYVNINGVDWDYVDAQLLKDLKVIELNELSGAIKVWGEGAAQDIYRKEYRELVALYGKDSVLLPGESSDNALQISVKVGKNAFNVKMGIIERYIETHQEMNEYGEYETITEIKERDYSKSFVINVANTTTGNSFLDLIAENPSGAFGKIEQSRFVNANKIDIGLALELPEPLALPEKSENLSSVSIGDILLFDKQTVVIVTKNAKNVNQAFTTIGKISDISLFIDLLDDDFELDYAYSLACMEEEIKVPEVNDDDYIEVEYDLLNYVDVEYDQANYIDVVYDEGNYLKVEYDKN